MEQGLRVDGGLRVSCHRGEEGNKPSKLFFLSLFPTHTHAHTHTRTHTHHLNHQPKSKNV